VEAVMLTGSTPKAELQNIYFRLTAQSNEKINSEKVIKLVYVTVRVFWLFAREGSVKFIYLLP
jgi:hypothetical protein